MFKSFVYLVPNMSGDIRGHQEAKLLLLLGGTQKLMWELIQNEIHRSTVKAAVPEVLAQCI